MSETYYVGDKHYAEYPGRLRATLSILTSRMAKYSTLGTASRSSERLFDDFTELLMFAREVAPKEPSVERMLPLLDEASALMSPAAMLILKFLHAEELFKLSRIYDFYDKGENRRLKLEDAFEPIARGDDGAVLSFYEAARATVESMRENLDDAVKLYSESRGEEISGPVFLELPKYLENLDRRLDSLWVTAFLDEKA